MVRHIFEVIIDVEDDDQTDPEDFLVDHLRSILTRKFAKDNEEYGITNWPVNTEVNYLRTTLTYVAPIKEEADGKSDKDGRSKG